MSEIKSIKNSAGRGSGTPGRPKLNVADAEAVVRSEYGIEGVASPLPSDRDQNFVIQASDGSRYVLKISNSDASRAHLEAQEQAMILGATANISVPRVISGASDQSLIEYLHPESGQHLVRLVSFLEGEPMARANPRTARLLNELGQFIGKLDHALVLFD